jgi:hypothetical protein
VPPASERLPHNAGTDLLSVGLGVEVAGRQFTYNDGITSNLRPYDISGTLMPVVWGELYPFAATSLPVLRDLGAVFSYAAAFDIRSVAADGQVVSTAWRRGEAGLRERFRPAGARGPVVGVSGTLGSQEFLFSNAGALQDQVPSVSYTTLRAAFDGRLPLWRFALTGCFGYDGALSAGQVEGRFRGASIGGIDAGAGVAFRVATGVETLAGFDYTRYFYAFHPQPGDAYVAGGALDQFFGFRLGASYVY